jgi:hypothetical protein
MGLLTDRPEEDDDGGEIALTGLEDLTGDGDETIFPLDDWSERGRSLARERFETLGVPHRWEGPAIVVAAADEAWAERVLDQVEDDLAVGLDPDAPQVAYDLAEWDPLERERLYDVLDDEAVPFEVDGDELFVHEIDEQRVDEVVTGIVSPGAEPDPAGEADQAVMGELFVAADRLVHDPTDTDAALQLADVVGATAGTNAPYGMDPVWWNGVLERSERLRQLLDVEDLDHEGIVEGATALRDGLRPYV